MRRGIIGVAVLAVLVVPAAAWAGHPRTAECSIEFCAGLSPDGSRVVFPFAEELTRGADRPQIYEWSAEGLRGLVPFPTNAPKAGLAGLVGRSADLQHVFVETNLALSPEDTDGGAPDIYDVSGGVATLISTGPLDNQSGGSSLVSFGGASEDGRRVFFESAFAPLLPEDTDRCPDLYERSEGRTKLISTGPTATPSYPPWLCDSADFGGISSDGSHVFFSTGDHLVPEDEGDDDIYQRVGDALSVLTAYPENGGGCVDRPEFGDASADGRTVLFATNMPISAEDMDSTFDVYKREPDGTFTLVSRGTDGGTGTCGFGGDRPVALSADGHTAIFETRSRLSPEDRDSSNDLYSADDNGAISLVSTGPTDPNVDEQSVVFPDWVADVSDDASRVAFETRQRLAVADRDRSMDVYVRGNGETELVSTGPLDKGAENNAELLGISADGTTVLLATKEQLTEQDWDHKKDVYRRRVGRHGIRTVLVSAESIAPRMQIGSRGRTPPGGGIEVRIGCPKAEKSGPCHGKVKLATGRHGMTIGSASFRIVSGKRKLIPVSLHRSVLFPRHFVFARARGIDRLGNAATTVRGVTIAARRSR